MQCMWEGCSASLGSQKEFTSHVNKHARESDDRACQWAGCARKGERKQSKSTLLTHIRIHTRERPFKCKICDKEYSRADALSKHTRSHEQTAADESVYAGKVSYLLLLKAECDLMISAARESYRRLVLENDILMGALLKRK